MATFEALFLTLDPVTAGVAKVGTIAADPIYVVATSEIGTRRAFEEAARRVRAAGGRIVIVVPHLLPFGADRCGCDLTHIAEPYCALARPEGCSTIVMVCICRETCDVCSMIPVNPAIPSAVVLAGRRARWHPSREERLAQALEREGHEVEFVDLGAPPRERTLSGIF